MNTIVINEDWENIGPNDYLSIVVLLCDKKLPSHILNLSTVDQ